ncbi:MAG: SGNH/GDSL hydrolase family protein, partial [Verrucomicrobiia bacterium]
MKSHQRLKSGVRLIGVILSSILCFGDNRSSGEVTAQESATLIKPHRILFLGNSITRHGPKQDIGWSGNWGMAASAEEKDFAHLVARALGKTAGAAPEVMIKNIAEFERQYAKYDAAAKLKDAFGFGADIIVIAIGENVPGLSSDEAKTQFRDSLRTLLKGLKS